MPVKVRCRECKKIFGAPDAARGKGVKCPECKSPVRVPAAKKKSSATSVSATTSDELLSGISSASFEDKSADVCLKCGGDYSEETGECLDCGYNPDEQAAARKRGIGRGSDPGNYIRNVFSDSWTFTTKNKVWVTRTIIVWLLFPALTLGTGWLTLWFAKIPLKFFFGFFTFLLSILPIGWWWFLDLEVIRQTMAKNKTLKRFNRDTFKNMGLGIKVLLWQAAIGAQTVVGLVGVGLLVYGNSSNDASMLIPGIACLGIAFAMTFLIFPLAMAHMSMPVTSPGWQLKVLLPVLFKNFKPTFVWCAVALLTHLPAIGCVAAIGAVYGNELNEFYAGMQSNFEVTFAKDTIAYAEENNKEAPPELVPIANRDILEIDYEALVPPVVLLFVACFNVGLMGPFNMRSNGSLVANCHKSFDLVTSVAQRTYVSKAEVQKQKEAAKAAKIKEKKRLAKAKAKAKEKAK